MKFPKVLLYCIMGTMLEWYDFAIFGILSPILAQVFFPHQDKTTSLLLSLLVFATGFIMRPFGGVFFGHIGDKYGRKKAIVASVFLMALASTAIGLLPIHHHHLYLTIMPLLLLRLLQGFAVSGEYAGMFTFIGEVVAKKHYFFCQSFVAFSASLGMLLGTFIGNIVLSLHHGNMLGNAWRIPFLLSFFLGFIGLYFRLKATESPVFVNMLKNKQTVKLPIKVVSMQHYKTIIFLVLLAAGDAAGFYYAIIYYPTFVKQASGIAGGYYLHIATMGLILFLLLTPMSGYLADKVGAEKLMKAGFLGLVLLPIPILLLVHHYPSYFALGGECMFVLCVALLEPLMAPFFTLFFPNNVRFTGISMAINITVVLFSATCPLIAVSLVHWTGVFYASAFFVIAANLLSFLVLLGWQQSETKTLFIYNEVAS